MRAVIESAGDLSPAEQEGIAKQLGRLFGKTILAQHVVNGKLIGGVVARIGGAVLDGSVVYQLRRLRDQMTNV